MQVEEVIPPSNTRSRLASAIMGALQFAGQFTDIIVHQGSPIHIESINGTVSMRELNLPGSDFVVDLNDIKAFYCSYISDASSEEEPNKFWKDNVLPKLQLGQSINKSIKTPGETYIRFNLYQFQGGKVAMVVRVTHPPRAITASGIPSDLVAKIAEGAKGLLILTGPTASGKTASALSILDYINNNGSGHIVTIEDPIEYVMSNKNCVFSQRGVGDDVSTFAAGLIEALRQCPKVLLVGEVRDRETAETAILASESGCLVIITTHGQTITGALRKITYLLGEQTSKAMLSVMAGSLIGVLRQELIPITETNGYVMVCDSLNNTTTVREIIERGAWEELEKLQLGLRSNDHTSMNQQLAMLVKHKKILPQQAIRHSTNKAGMKELIAAHKG